MCFPNVSVMQHYGDVKRHSGHQTAISSFVQVTDFPLNKCKESVFTMHTETIGTVLYSYKSNQLW